MFSLVGIDDIFRIFEEGIDYFSIRIGIEISKSSSNFSIFHLVSFRVKFRSHFFFVLVGRVGSSSILCYGNLGLALHSGTQLVYFLPF